MERLTNKRESDAQREEYERRLANGYPRNIPADRDEIALPIVNAAPTVDAEVVVRCKDCTHYDLGVCLKIYSDGNMHTEAWQPRRPDDFCSYGERKDGDNAT